MAYDGHLCHRLRYLPHALEAAERKLAALYREAESYKMKDILEDCRFYNDSWDSEVEAAHLTNLIDDLRAEKAARNAA